jgi:CHAT domain-containing protein
LEKALQGVKAISYSPAGLLHKIALGALPVGTTDNQLLQDRYNMHLVSSTREVNRLKKENANMMATDRVTLYGGLQYDHRPTAPSLAKTTSAATQSYIHHHHRSFNVAPPHLLRGAGDVPDGWNYLEGTRTETREIVSVLQQKRISNRYYSGTNGKEETFKALSGTPVHVIHLATHGFFLPDVVVKRRPELAQMLGGDDEERVVENPLLRSGLVLSGVNKAWMAKEPVNAADEEDGILTADEISKLNLTKTKLVVLSACETGLGDINNSEGVFGLQRAFKLAGAESLIMSLWKVPDEATSLLMRSFYEQWIGGASKQAAFKAAQKRVRERYVEPYYWAAFVMMD